MEWRWRKVCCCDKFIQEGFTPVDKVKIVKVPSKLLVVLQSAAASASSSSSSGGCGNNSSEDENVVDNVQAKWLPNLDELIRYLPKDLTANIDLQNVSETLSSLTAQLPPDIMREIEKLVGALKGGAK